MDIEMSILTFVIPDGCPLAGFILHLEESSFTSTLMVLFSLLFLVLVVLDKKIKFRRVIGMEHLLRMRKFSSSEHIFTSRFFIPLTTTALIVAVFKTIYTEANPTKDSVSTFGVSGQSHVRPLAILKIPKCNISNVSKTLAYIFHVFLFLLWPRIQLFAAACYMLGFILGHEKQIWSVCNHILTQLI